MIVLGLVERLIVIIITEHQAEGVGGKNVSVNEVPVHLPPPVCL